MSKWLNWQVVVPRVVAFVVVVLGVQYVLGIAARSLAVRSGEALTSGKVEVAHARVSLDAKRVVLSGLTLQGTGQFSKNTLAADRCELNFAAIPALRKQVVIESGRLSGLRFNGFDADCADHATPAKNATTANWFKADVDAAAQLWFDRLNGQLNLDAVKDFASVTRTEKFCTNWSKQSADLQSRLQALDTRASTLQKSIEAAEANPLRNDKALGDLKDQMASVRKDFVALQTEIDKLPDLLEDGRREIVAARRQDDQAAGKRLQVDAVEAGSLSAYLLQDEFATQLTELMTWVRAMRAMAPADAKIVSPNRGESVPFAGCQPRPDLLIRSLQLDGSARIAGQPVELSGLLMDLSSAPRLHPNPIRLHLVGSGQLPLDVRATIDHTQAIPREELIVECRGILLRSMKLGQQDQLSLAVAPSVGTLSMRVVVNGDNLNGEVQLVQQMVQMTPQYKGSEGEVLSATMADTLGSVKSIATRVSLGGTIQQPTCNLWSNLGSEVAESVQRAVRRTGDHHAKALLAEAGRLVDERLANVDRQLTERQAEFAGQTTAISARLQRIAISESPRYRISSEKAGRRLPNNSLFR